MAGRLDWIEPWDRVLEWDPPHARWFLGGRINVSANCLDRHLAKRGDQTALIWEGDDPSESKHITYRQAHEEVCRMANVLKALRAANKLGMTTIALTGEAGKAASIADIALQIPSRSVPRIQEAHIVVGHILCELTDALLFKNVEKR